MKNTLHSTNRPACVAKPFRHRFAPGATGLMWSFGSAVIPLFA